MPEIEVQRYDMEPVDSLGTAYTIGGEPSPTGEVCMWDDIAPLLAELATLRERTRRRDAATEPPPEGVWVNGLTTTGRIVIARFLDGDWCDEHGVWECGMRAWWPLPPTEE